VLQQQLHAGQRVAQLVGDARRQAADGRQPLGPQHFAPRRLQLVASSPQTIHHDLHLFLDGGQVGASTDLHRSQQSRGR
jgi:hypothetical protein